MNRNRLPREEYDALVKSVFTRDNWRCIVCRIRSQLHAHHVTFRSHGGKDELTNLCTVCADCHDAIHKYKIKIEHKGDAFSFTKLKDWSPRYNVR